MEFFTATVALCFGIFLGRFVRREDKIADYEDRIADLEARNQANMDEAQAMINQHDAVARGLRQTVLSQSRALDQLHKEVAMLRAVKSSPLSVDMIPVRDDSFVPEVSNG